MMRWIATRALETLIEGRLARVQAGGVTLALVRRGDAVHAVQDRCSHENFSLSDGFVDGDRIHCALHGAAFDLNTGEALTAPAYEAIEVFPVRIEGGMVLVGVEE